MVQGQLDSLLSDAEWVRAPITKDLVKTDLEVMGQEGVVRKVGNSRKWALKEATS